MDRRYAERPSRRGLVAAPSWCGPATIRVLLVEDDDIDAKLIRLLAASIAMPNILIDRATSTAEARRLMVESRFDLCILDYWLGCESSQRLLTDISKELPTIMLSSLSTSDIRQMCQQLGAVGFLGKERLASESLLTAIIEVHRSVDKYNVSTVNPVSDLLLSEFVAVIHSMQVRRSTEYTGFHERQSLRVHLSAMMQMTETVRFGLFERVSSLDRCSTSGSTGPWTEDVGRVIAVVIEIAHGILEARGQTVTFCKPMLPIGLSYDPAMLFFVIFELIVRISQLSASDSQLKAKLSFDRGSLCLLFESNAWNKADGDALGPLFAQVLHDHGGTVRTTFGPGRELTLTAYFAGPPGSDLATTLS